jgi:RNA polymerase sigma factor (sigma-70 family)
MEELIELVRRYREAPDVDERQRAAEEIIRKIGPKLLGYLLRACHRQTLAEDLCQDACVKIAIKLHQFRGKSDAEFRGWCFQIAQRTLADYFKKERPEEHLEPFNADALWATIEAAGQENPFPGGDRADLEYAMSLLEAAKPPCRGLLWSHYIRGLDYVSVGKLYGIEGYDPVRVRINRCLELAMKLVAKHP